MSNNPKKALLPKGFRLHKAIKEILIERLCYERWSLTLNWHLRQERYLFNRVMDVLFPPHRKFYIRQHYERLPLCPELSRVTAVNAVIDYDRHNRNMSESQYVHFNLGAKHALPERLSHNMYYNWRFRQDPNKHLMQPVEIDEDLLKYHRAYPEDNGCLAFRMPLLPQKLRRELSDYFRGRAKFHRDYDQFRELAQRSIMPLTSAKQVKELNEKVFNILIILANEYRPPCSDVDMADDNCTLQKLM